MLLQGGLCVRLLTELVGPSSSGKTQVRTPLIWDNNHLSQLVITTSSESAVKNLLGFRSHYF